MVEEDGGGGQDSSARQSNWSWGGEGEGVRGRRGELRVRGGGLGSDIHGYLQ
jgi:hypothetical protein